MSRRGNCHDNAVAESFFSLLKTERIKRRIYKTRNEARADIFNYIEFFYNPVRRHGNNDGLPPMQFEKQYFMELSGDKQIGGSPCTSDPNSANNLTFKLIRTAYYPRRTRFAKRELFVSYVTEWNAAVERSKALGFEFAAHTVEPQRRYLNDRQQAEFPYVVRDGLGELDFPDLVGQCLCINFRLRPVIERWLDCPVLYTIGWIDDQTERGMFRFDDIFIAEKLSKGHQAGTVNIHAWLTLPSMEIIDVALSTTMGVLQKKPEMYGLVMSLHADSLKGMAFKPMLVGTDFLERSGMLRVSL